MATPTSKPPRVIDPDIAELRKKHAKAVSALKGRQRSAAITKTFMEERLPNITQDDRNKIFDHLKQIVTPALPIKSERSN